MSDLFGGLEGGLGGLVKGLASVMPQDDPDVQLFNAQSEAAELQKQENELYASIGRRAVEENGLDSFGELADRMKLTQSNLIRAKARIEVLQREKEAREQAERRAAEERTCPQCGHENPEGTKFCRECGAKLGMEKNLCPSCGAENASGVKFCQECGARLASIPVPPALCPSCGAENRPGVRFCGECGAGIGGA